MADLNAIVETALAKAMTRYTVASENVERVVDLAVDDVLKEVGPEVESLVRGRYEGVLKILRGEG